MLTQTQLALLNPHPRY